MSGRKQSLICQQSHKHEPTPTNVNINDVNALITMSVLFDVASLDVTTTGGFGHCAKETDNMLKEDRNTFFLT